ncbi:MAG: type II secretion system F family protein [Stenotrophomonas maltophilia]
MEFRYMALTADNAVVRGKVEATEEQSVDAWLAEAGYQVISIKRASATNFFEGVSLKSNRVSPKELVLFFQQLSALMRSGVPLLNGIQLLRAEAKSSGFQTLLTGLATDLRSGESLGDSLAKYPKIVPEMYVRLIEAGEHSGNLEYAFEEAAIHLKKEITLKQQVKKALTYPAIVGVVGLIVIAILVTVVLPTMTELLTSFGTELPLISRIVVGISNFVSSWRLVILAGAVALGVLFMLGTRTHSGRRELSRLLINAPGIKKVVIQLNLARFSRTLSLLLKSGSALPESLQMAGDTVSNYIFREAVADVRTQVMQGAALGRAVEALPFMPPLYVQMVMVGEESGSLETNLANMAAYYEEEVENQLNTLTALIEPALTVTLGVIVGFIALAVILPILQLYETVAAST